MQFFKSLLFNFFLLNSTSASFFQNPPEPIEKTQNSKSLVVSPLKLRFDLSLFLMPGDILSLLQEHILDWVSRRVGSMVSLPHYDSFRVGEYPNCTNTLDINFKGSKIGNVYQDVLVVVLPFKNISESVSFKARSKICFLDPRNG